MAGVSSVPHLDHSRSMRNGSPSGASEGRNASAWSRRHGVAGHGQHRGRHVRAVEGLRHQRLRRALAGVGGQQQGGGHEAALVAGGVEQRLQPARHLGQADRHVVLGLPGAAERHAGHDAGGQAAGEPWPAPRLMPSASEMPVPCDWPVLVPAAHRLALRPALGDALAPRLGVGAPLETLCERSRACRYTAAAAAVASAPPVPFDQPLLSAVPVPCAQPRVSAVPVELAQPLESAVPVELPSRPCQPCPALRRSWSTLDEPPRTRTVAGRSRSRRRCSSRPRQCCAVSDVLALTAMPAECATLSAAAGALSASRRRRMPRGWSPAFRPLPFVQPWAALALPLTTPGTPTLPRWRPGRVALRLARGHRIAWYCRRRPGSASCWPCCCRCARSPNLR